MHEVRRMIATLREIFMKELCSIKSLVYASMIARAFNRVAENIVHYYLIHLFLSPLFVTSIYI